MGSGYQRRIFYLLDFIRINGGQRGNRTPDTRIFNGVLQNILNNIIKLEFEFRSVLRNVLPRHGRDQKLAYLRQVDYVVFVLLCQSLCP